jgi:nucleotide-binding universal stress UspA family protein
VPIEPVLRRGRFHKTILKEARELGASAVVIGGWRRSVTRKDATSVERQLILDQADCPVIVVKDEETRSSAHG